MSPESSNPKPIRTTVQRNFTPAQFPTKPATLPELFFTAFSILCLFSSSSSKILNPTIHFQKIPFFSFHSNSRRFLKISPMSQTHNRHHFATPQSLSDWLKPRLPSDSFASWGIKPGTKNVHNLWLEVSEGETSLADSSPPVRTVNVVSVRIIGKDGKTLVESHQELSDGKVRSRCRPLSEKMKPDETPEEAVVRAVKEELGSILQPSNNNANNEIDGGVVRIVPGSYRRTVEERNSLSYPGLPAVYVLHTVEAMVDGLPEGEFCTEEAEEYSNRDTDKAVSVKKHFWKWVSSDSISS